MFPRILHRREICWAKKWSSTSLRERCGDRAETMNPVDLAHGRTDRNPTRSLCPPLGSIAIDQRDIRGRNVVVWISPNWPANGGDIGFDEATELSTRLREARITLDNVNVWPNPDPSFSYHDYLEAPRSHSKQYIATVKCP